MMTEKKNRRRSHLLERACVRGADPDGVNWPMAKKPHIYYW